MNISGVFNNINYLLIRFFFIYILEVPEMTYNALLVILQNLGEAHPVFEAQIILYNFKFNFGLELAHTT